MQLPSPAVLGLTDLLAAAGGPLHAALSIQSPPGWQHAAVAATHCHLWRLDSAQLFAALKEQHPALLAHLARRLIDWLSDGGGAAAGSEALEQQQQQGKQAGEEAAAQQQEAQQACGSSAGEACLLLKQLAADLESAAAAMSVQPSKRSSWAAGSRQLALQRPTAGSEAPSGCEEGDAAEEVAALQAVAEPAAAAGRIVGFVWGD